MNSEIKTCQNCSNNFQIEPEDFDFYNKIKVSPPTWCPECRLIRRLAFRNERALYRRKCDLCQKDIISIYSQDKPFKIYCNSCWWSDKWNPLDYSQDYDFSKPFHEQFDELSKKVPHVALFVLHSSLVNSEYTNQVSYLKNCYLIFNADYDENCAYGSEIESSKDSFDNLQIDKCTLCYNDVNCKDCYKTIHSIDCENCFDVYFSRNLVGCQNCFGCVNLRNKSYHIFNQQYSKEEYDKKIEKLLNNYKTYELEEKRDKLAFQNPMKYMHERRNLNVSGDYVYQSKNTKQAFIATGAENCKYCMWLLVPPIKDCYDFTEYGDKAELIYDSCVAGDGVNDVKFSRYCLKNLRNIEYSLYCSNSHDLFGCVSVRNGEYCILNKKYSKEEYEQLKAKIIEQMRVMPYKDKNGREYKYGEFPPIETSSFAYNETSAQQYFPLTKEQAIEKGYNWKDPEERNIQIDLKSEDLPDHIKDVNDDILNKVIECGCEGHGNEHPAPEQAPVVREISTTGQARCGAGCTTAFKIIKPELDFYRKMNLPLPRLCPNCRHYQRLKQRNPLKLWKRQCQCQGNQGKNPNNPNIYQNTITHQHGTEPCLNTFETTYNPDRPEIVYCEKCYNSEVV